MKKLIALAAFLVAPLAAPAAVLAQGNGPSSAEESPADEMAGMMGMLGGMFEQEPLTAEQEARLPAATALVEKIVPPGTMGEVMGSMFDGMLGPLMELATASPSAALNEQLGLPPGTLGMDEEAASQAAGIIDPSWQLRREREAAIFPQIMDNMMVAMEPTIKSVMSQLYAVYFDDTELTDIDAFFSTQSGAAYARKSFTMSADPRMAGAMVEAMPAIFASLAEMEAQMAAATADLPEPRSYQQLSAAERDTLAGLLGMTEQELADAFSQAGAQAIQ